MKKIVNVSAAIHHSAAVLQEAGIAEPRREAASLLRFVLEKDAAFLIAHPEHELSASQTTFLESCVRRRGMREPLQYITGRQEFWGLDFKVSPSVLIPRPETELLVESAIEALEGPGQPRFVEVGVGSGCVSVAILYSMPGARVVATDISDAALEVARQNAEKHSVASRLELIREDLYPSGAFDLIVSNPPYIPTADIAGLEPEVRDHEPRAALDGGSDGLDVIRRLVHDGGHILAGGGVLMMEIGAGQAVAVDALFEHPLWDEPRFKQDLQGIDRVVICRRR